MFWGLNELGHIACLEWWLVQHELSISLVSIIRLFVWPEMSLDFIWRVTRSVKCLSKRITGSDLHCNHIILAEVWGMDWRKARREIGRQLRDFFRSPGKRYGLRGWDWWKWREEDKREKLGDNYFLFPYRLWTWATENYSIPSIDPDLSEKKSSNSIRHTEIMSQCHRHNVRQRLGKMPVKREREMGRLLRSWCRPDPKEGRKEGRKGRNGERVLDCSEIIRKFTKVTWQRSPSSHRNGLALVSLTYSVTQKPLTISTNTLMDFRVRQLGCWSITVGEFWPAELSWPPRLRINLSRHDLLGEERLANLSEEKGLKPLSQWAFIEFSLHRYT